MGEPWLVLDVVVRGAGPRLALTSSAPVVGVAGPSGAGKSTLLRVLAGVEPRTEGRLRVFGEDWSRLPAWRRGVGWVPQDAVLFPHLSVRENLAYARGAVDPAVVADLGLDGLLDRAPRHLSGGERQRVALGRALCAAPRLLLLDEPFGALDPALRVRVAASTATFCRARGVRAVLVSHDDADLAAFDAERWTVNDRSLQRGA